MGTPIENCQIYKGQKASGNWVDVDCIVEDVEKWESILGGRPRV